MLMYFDFRRFVNLKFGVIPVIMASMASYGEETNFVL